MQQIDSDSADHAKRFLTRSLLNLLSREDTARTINAILSAQIERLLIAPIGRLGDHVSPGCNGARELGFGGANHRGCA